MRIPFPCNKNLPPFSVSQDWVKWPSGDASENEYQSVDIIVNIEIMDLKEVNHGPRRQIQEFDHCR